jgi:predicted ATPase
VLCTEQRFAQSLAVGTSLHGWALVEQGQHEAGIAQMRQGIAALQATGAEAHRLYFLALLAEAHTKVSRAEEGLAVLAEALTAVEQTAQHAHKPELYRFKGELLLQQAVPDAPQAEACLQQSLAEARRQQAKSLELRAATSLSRVWQRQGRHQEAHDLLAPIYGWFTEGFDTADLQDAKVLLEELGG